MTHELVCVHKGTIVYTENEGGGSISVSYTHLDVYKRQVLLRTEDNSALRLYVSRIPTEYLSLIHISGIKFHFPYPTGIHTDNACDWDANDKHSTEVLKQDIQSAVL